jgi:hypothetical protein
MTSGRFTDSDIAPPTEAPTTNGFLLFAAAPAVAPPQGTMQWFYQRLYEEASKAAQPAPSRELFKVMN